MLETLWVMLFVFLLVFARPQGYTTTLAELWAQCRALDAPLPQPVSDAALSKARPQLDENEFKPRSRLRSCTPVAGPLSTRHK